MIKSKRLDAGIEHPSVPSRDVCTCMYVHTWRKTTLLYLVRCAGCYSSLSPFTACLISLSRTWTRRVNRRAWLKFWSVFSTPSVIIARYACRYREMKDFSRGKTERRCQRRSRLNSYLVSLIHDVAHDFLIQWLGDSPHGYHEHRDTWVYLFISLIIYLFNHHYVLRPADSMTLIFPVRSLTPANH